MEEQTERLHRTAMKAWGISRAEFYSERKREGGEMGERKKIKKRKKEGKKKKNIKIKIPSEIKEIKKKKKKRREREGGVKKKIRGG
mgnify:CR=1 FL=1